MTYIGSTLSSVVRFQHHLIGNDSNIKLQAAILKYGISSFTAYVFEVVVFPEGATYNTKIAMLRVAEQRYLDMYPTSQLYNTIKAQA
jgi:hypothetical protein